MERLDKSFHTAAGLLPERLWRAAYTLTDEQKSACEELRVRVDRPLAATVAGETILLGKTPVLPQRAELDELLARATEASVHTYLEQLRQGYLTTRHGHRLGVCGEISGGGKALRGLSSVNIRVARPVEGAADGLNIWDTPFVSTLILAPPGAGKTTLLREICRRLSAGMRVAVADERYEIAACADGSPRFAVGNCDVLSGGSKRETALRLVRAMSPQVVAVDEITDEEDCRALLSCAGCGVLLLATAHGGDLRDLTRRPGYRALMEADVFRRVIRIGRRGGRRDYTVTPLPVRP